MGKEAQYVVRLTMERRTLKLGWAATLAALLALSVADAQADDYYWDINGVTAGAGGATPTGTWSTNGTYWSHSSTGGSAGTAHTTDTTDALYFAAGADATGTYTVTLGGTGQSAGNITFQEGNVTIAGQTLTLNAASIITTTSASDTISSRIAGAGTSLTKAGAGTLILSGVNAYTGSNIVNDGTLQFKGASALPSGTAISLGTATLQIRNDGVGSNGTISLGNSITLTTNNLTHTIDVGNNGSGTGNTVAFGALKNGTTADAFANVINFTGVNGYLVSFSSLGLPGSTGNNTTLNPTSTSVTITGNVTNQQTSFSSHFDTLFLDGTSAGNAINGVISDSSGYTSVGNGDTRITKSSTSIWTLAGNNTYHGPTTISGGILVAGHANALGSGTIANNATLAVDTGVTFTRGVTWGSSSTLAGRGTYTPSDTFTVASGMHVAPGIGDAGTLAIGNNTSFSSGSFFNVDLNGATADRLNVTGTVAVTSGANLAFNTINAPTAGKYILLTASSGTFSNSFTASGTPSDYRVLMNGSTELDLTHKATLGTLGSVTPANTQIITGGSTAFTFTLPNSAPANSSDLQYTAGTFSNVTGAASGSVTANTTSGAIGGLAFNGTTVGLSKTGTFQVSDTNATNGPVGGTVTVDVLAHASAHLSNSSFNFGNVLLNAPNVQGQTDLTTNVTNGAGLYVASLGSGLSGASIGNVIANGGMDKKTLTATVDTSVYNSSYSPGFTVTTDDQHLPGGHTGYTSTITGGGNVGIATTVGVQNYTSATILNAVMAQNADLAGLASKTLLNAGNGVLGTEAILRDGLTSSVGSVSEQWRTRTAADIHQLVCSDVLDLTTPTGSNNFVLQMSYDPTVPWIGSKESELALAKAIYVAYNAGTSGITSWVNASSNVAGGFKGVVAWNASYNTLGDWGVDTANSLAWVVVNHNSEFAVVPEPGTLAILAAGLLSLLAYAWRRKRTV